MTALGNTSDREVLANALEALERTKAGASIVTALRQKGTQLRLGPTPHDTIAWFDPVANEIVISHQCRRAPMAAIAAHLAHEGSHLQWDEPNSIDQEYHAFRAQAAVWNELKGNESDRQCDAVSRMIARGEMAARAEIAFLYPELLSH